MEHLPSYVYIVFIIALAICIGLFYMATKRSGITLTIIGIWLVIQGIIGFSGFYTITYSTPPRVMFLLIPPLLTILFLFLTVKGRKFIDNLDIKYLTLLSILRLPVELVLLWLSVRKLIPQAMTFEGRNFDIFSGITAPAIFYFGFVQKKLGRNLLLTWNLVCLGLLVNVVTIAILAIPGPFQQLALDQPNIGVLYFPFIWLPCIIVPIVLFSHLASIRQLTRHKNQPQTISLEI